MTDRTPGGNGRQYKDACVRLNYRKRSDRPRPSGTSRNASVRRDLYLRWECSLQACAICGDARFQLHHAWRPEREDYLACVPLCAEHHREISTVIVPILCHQYSLEQITCAYLVHGPLLADWLLAQGPADGPLGQMPFGALMRDAQQSFDL